MTFVHKYYFVDNPQFLHFYQQGYEHHFYWN